MLIEVKNPKSAFFKKKGVLVQADDFGVYLSFKIRRRRMYFFSYSEIVF